MPVPTTPYSSYLDGRDPIAAIHDTLGQVHALTHAWTPERFEQSYAPGKWTARQVLAHLAQSEMALGTRARMAVTSPAYVAQPWDQEAWIALDDRLSGPDAAAAFEAMARMNLACFSRLSPVERAKTLEHPEYGALTVDWVLYQLAGHQVNHLRQLQRLSGR